MLLGIFERMFEGMLHGYQWWSSNWQVSLHCCALEHAAKLLQCWMQMPKGVPVATVAIGNAANAGLLALRILTCSDSALQQKMMDYQVSTKPLQVDKPFDHA